MFYEEPHTRRTKLKKVTSIKLLKKLHFCEKSPCRKFPKKASAGRINIWKGEWSFKKSKLARRTILTEGILRKNL